MHKIEKADRGLKRKSTIAVFEHVVEENQQSKNKRFRTNRFLEEDSASELELVIDDKPIRKTRVETVKFSEEPLTLICQWNSCNLSFEDYNQFIMHLMQHYHQSVEDEELTCLWNNCSIEQPSNSYLKQHISYHGYITKLINIGSNVLQRSHLPSCKESTQKITFPIEPDGYFCEWIDCDLPHVETITDLHHHMLVHIKNNPKSSKNNEVIKCYWKGCNSNNTFVSQYKLAEHVHVHSKEKSLACPTCHKLFSTKTKFRDHRKRQLSTDLQSYQCSQCFKLFASERLLRDHMRSHINHYKCTMCDMTCPKPSNLAIHIRMKHIKIKPFKCDQCPKSFVRELNLKTHLQTHMKDSFACQECDFKCKSLYGLNKHYVVEHAELQSIYQCHSCKAKFGRGGHLTKHLMITHNYHWPSGHSRFKYRRDHDGIFRLQTVRYESLEVTEEMIRSETQQQKQTIPQPLSFNIKYGENVSKEISLSPNDIHQVESNDVSPNCTTNNLLITIEDVDEDGNVLNSKVLEANEIFLSNEETDCNDQLKEFLVLKDDNLKEQKLKKSSSKDEKGDLEEFLILNKNKGSKKTAPSRKKRKCAENKDPDDIAQLHTEIKIEDDDVKREDEPTDKKGKTVKKQTCGYDKETQVKEKKSEDIHYFSKEIILNYDKFKIVSTKK